ncbi:MAG: SDR family NAD(P)-dependent oxidoreductase [Opitutales bacterium]|nr:SDR family NAD(P)-dependent oxidoreductase [Opitutales bacterium]
MPSEKNKTVLVTGATSGIGEALANQLSREEGYRFILCGRRAERLGRGLKEGAEWTPLSFDVRDRSAVEAAIKSLPEGFQEIDVLVNNAGNAHGLDPIDKGSVEDWEAMIDINLKGLLYLSKIVSQGMVERKRGQIINIGSIAGKEAYPSGNVYCATKAAVDTLTQGMRMDLFEHGIRVAALHPGLTETEFSEVRFKGDKERASKIYEGLKPLTAEDVANSIAFMIAQPEHINIADLLILPTIQASATRKYKPQT